MPDIASILQLAICPVILISGVGLLLLTMTNRFGRVIDREKAPLGVETLSVFQDPFSRQEWLTDFQGVRVTLLEYFKLLYFKSFW